MDERFGENRLTRYRLSSFTLRQLKRDHIRFECKYAEKFPNSFVCRILVNYMSYAQDNFAKRFEEEVRARLDDGSRKKSQGNYRMTFTNVLTNKMAQFDFVKHPKLAEHKSRVVTYILEKFAALSIAEREKIYCYPHFKIIGEAMEKNAALILHSSDGCFEVKPYALEVDENALSYYLAGFSRKSGSDDSFGCYSFKLSRITECSSNNKDIRIPPEEIANMKKMIEKFGCAYLMRALDMEDSDTSVVWLTKKGYEKLFLRRIAHQRPVPIAEPKKISEKHYSYELEFDCSHRQIKNYFFLFGEEAFVVKPENEIRNKFRREYKAAAERYSEAENSAAGSDEPSADEE